MELSSRGKVIGNIYCGKRDFNAREVGYIVNKNYQQKGYATEALCAVLDYLFQKGYIAFMPSATLETFHLGNCWRRWGKKKRRT